MTRSEYIEAIGVITAFIKECDDLATGIQGLIAPESHKPCVLFGHKLQAAYTDLVEESIGDSSPAPYSSWTRWFLYEGGPGERVCYLHDVKHVVKDAGDLYDFIQKWNLKENEG